MWERLRRFSELDQPARGMFLRATALLPFVCASLRIRGFRKTQALLQKRFSEARDYAGPAPGSIAQLTARMVRAAVRHGFGHPTCLEQSLVLWWLLRRQGIVSDLRIGVRRAGGKFQAHAWVEYAGAALNQVDAAHEHYAAFDGALGSIHEASR